MPRNITYNPQLGLYQIRCEGNGCDAGHTLNGNNPHRNSEGIDGSRVEDTFLWYERNGRFSYLCRNCTRAHRRAAATSGPRASRTRRAFTALGLTRRFGVELELTFRRGTERYMIQHALTDAGFSWRVKSDSSLSAPGRRAYEVVSPVLQGEAGLDEIRQVTRLLRTTFDAKPNRTCGMHVHHEIRDLTIDQIKSVYRTWKRQQDLIDGLVSESRRGGGNTYCRRISDDDQAVLEGCATVEQIQHRFDYYRRYRTLNMNAYGRYGTIEIRQHQGTCDGEKIASWIQFGQAMIDTAAGAEITGTPTRMRDLMGELGDRLGETARTFLLGRTVEFGAVAV